MEMIVHLVRGQGRLSSGTALRIVEVIDKAKVRVRTVSPCADPSSKKGGTLYIESVVEIKNLQVRRREQWLLKQRGAVS